VRNPRARCIEQVCVVPRGGEVAVRDASVLVPLDAEIVARMQPHVSMKRNGVSDVAEAADHTSSALTMDASVPEVGRDAMVGLDLPASLDSFTIGAKALVPGPYHVSARTGVTARADIPLPMRRGRPRAMFPRRALRNRRRPSRLRRARSRQRGNRACEPTVERVTSPPPGARVVARGAPTEASLRLGLLARAGRWWLSLALALCLPACPARRGADAGAGVACVFNDDCAGNLICAGHYCREQCRTDRDCANGYRCRPSEQPEKSVCLPPDAPNYCVYASECPSPLVCTREGACAMQCRTDRDCQQAGQCGVCLDGGVCDFHPDVLDGAPPPVCHADSDAGSSE
jgi:hypothetical protein